MNSTLKIFTCLLVLIGYFIVKICENKNPELHILGCMMLIMIVLILGEGMAWKQRLMNGVFYAGIAVMTALLLISMIR